MTNKPFLYAATALLLILAPMACTTDAYDKGEGEYSNLRADLADLTIDASRRAVSALTDEGDRLSIANPFTTSWMQQADTTYRAYLYYSSDGDAARVVSAGQVLVIRPRREASPKTDPVGLESIWMSTSRRYLNASLLLMVGQGGADDAHHVVGATLDTLIVNADRTRTLHLQLYHDQGGVPEYYTQRTYVSIPLAAVDADSVHLRVNTYDGIAERTVSTK